jgi:hypothetical protein
LDKLGQALLRFSSEHPFPFAFRPSNFRCVDTGLERNTITDQAHVLSVATDGIAVDYGQGGTREDRGCE